jgi:hypothetical protein
MFSYWCLCEIQKRTEIKWIQVKVPKCLCKYEDHSASYERFEVRLVYVYERDKCYSACAYDSRMRHNDLIVVKEELPPRRLFGERKDNGRMANSGVCFTLPLLGRGPWTSWALDSIRFSAAVRKVM